MTHAPTTVDVEMLTDLAIGSHDASEVATLAREVIAHGDCIDMLHFARLVPGADRARLQDEVISSGDAEAMVGFAKRVPSADVHALGEAVIASGDAEAMRDFAEDVPSRKPGRLRRKERQASKRAARADRKRAS